MKTSCPLCKNETYDILGSRNEYSLACCKKCSFMFLLENFQYESAYNDNYFNNYHNPQSLVDVEAPKKEGAFSYLDNEEVHLNTYRTMLGFLNRRRSLKGKKVLDVGCAGGSGLKVAKEFGAIPYGVDVSPHAVSLCKDQGLTGVYLGELDEVPERNLDVVVMHDVLEHMQDPHANLKALNIMLKKGGVVFVKNNLFSNDLFSTNKEYFNRQFEPPYHCSYFSKDLMMKIFNQHGFRISYEKPRWVNQAFDIYGSLKRFLKPAQRKAFEENKKQRLAPELVAKYSSGSFLGRYLNDLFPSGYIFEKVKESEWK